MKWQSSCSRNRKSERNIWPKYPYSGNPLQTAALVDEYSWTQKKKATSFFWALSQCPQQFSHHWAQRPKLPSSRDHHAVTLTFVASYCHPFLLRKGAGWKSGRKPRPRWRSNSFWYRLSVRQHITFNAKHPTSCFMVPYFKLHLLWHKFEIMKITLLLVGSWPLYAVLSTLHFPLHFLLFFNFPLSGVTTFHFPLSCTSSYLGLGL